MKIKITHVLFAASILLSSCSDSFLDKFPENSVNQDNAINNIVDCRQAVTGIYASLKEEASYNKYVSLLPDVQSDLVYSVIGYTNTMGSFYQWFLTTDTQEVKEVYQALYSSISKANFFIKNSAKATLASDEEKAEFKNLLGQAYFLRALCYSDLVKLYAKDYDPETAEKELGVSIVTDFVNGEPGRSTLAQSYEQILKDLEEAGKLLSTDASDSPVATVGAVNALKARVLLYMHRWDDAKSAATAVIGNKKYALADRANFSSMWIDDKGSEIIMKVALTPTDLGKGSMGGNFCANPGSGPMPDYIPAKWVVDLFDKTSDIRYATYFKYEPVSTTGVDWEIVYKFPGNPALKSGAPNYKNMAKVLRLAEMYLIRAEAYMELNDLPNANKDLNSLRGSRIKDYKDENLDKAQLVTAIRNERVKELFMEGGRLADLKRYRLGFDRVAQPGTNIGPNQNGLKVKSDNFMFVWPIPKHETDANKNVKQNAGY